MNSKLNPYYLVGLVDGEGCFCVSFNNHKSHRLIEVRLLFEIELREDDKEILERVKETLGCGNIYYLNYKRYQKWRPHYKYKVSNLKDITEKIIPFFTTYPLQAKKKESFNKFSEVAKLMLRKSHLSEEGIQHIKDWQETRWMREIRTSSGEEQVSDSNHRPSRQQSRGWLKRP